MGGRIDRAKRRQFTQEFKARLMLDILSGVPSQAEACRKHGLGPNLVALWKGWPQTCGKLDVGLRKLRTFDGQAPDAEILGSAPGRLS